MIDRFKEEHAFLSNFFIEPDGTTVEHEFQAAKTYNLIRKVEILAAREPGQAKRLGRKVELRADWEQKQSNGQPLKLNVMTDLVLRKFWDHNELAELLLATGDATLIEGNNWHDTYWGVCDGTCRQGPHEPGIGQNRLGLTLMDVRAVIDSFG